jgi:hypothetical protein
MSRWVRSYWDEEGITYVSELGDDGWVTRSVEFDRSGTSPTDRGGA